MDEEEITMPQGELHATQEELASGRFVLIMVDVMRKIKRNNSCFFTLMQQPVLEIILPMQISAKWSHTLLVALPLNHMNQQEFQPLGIKNFIPGR